MKYIEHRSRALVNVATQVQTEIERRMEPPQFWLTPWFSELFEKLTDLKHRDATFWVNYHADTGPEIDKPKTSHLDWDRYFGREGDALVAILPPVPHVSGPVIPILSFVRQLNTDARAEANLGYTTRTLHLVVVQELPDGRPDTRTRLFDARFVRTQRLIYETPVFHQLTDMTTGKPLSFLRAKELRRIFRK